MERPSNDYSSSHLTNRALFNESQISKPRDKIEAIFQIIKDMKGKDNGLATVQSPEVLIDRLSVKHKIWQIKTNLLPLILSQSSSHVSIKQATSGTNGCYFVKYNFENQKIEGVFKPINETEKTRAGIPENEQAVREYLGYMLSQYLTAHLIRNNIRINIQNFGVPPTSIASFDKISFSSEEGQIGSFQKYKEGVPLTDLPEIKLQNISRDELMKMLVMDIIMLNTDRHLGNAFLAPKDSIILIDQGSTFPGLASLKKGNTHDNLGFEWMFINFTQDKIPPAWQELILSIPPKELYTTLVEKLEELQSIYPDTPSLTIGGNVLFNSLVSLTFLQHWVKNVGQQLPSRELLRCFIPETIPYIYAVKKDSSKEITMLQEQSVHNFNRDRNSLANNLDTDMQEGKSGYFTTNPIFLSLVKDAYKDFENALALKNSEPINVQMFLKNWDVAEQTIMKRVIGLTFKETNLLAREYFSHK